MNCKNCGAVMKLLREPPCFHCEHCGSYHFPEQEDSGVRKLGPSPDGAQCPTCREPLLLASYDDRHSVRYCDHCRGILFQRWDFGATIERERAWAESAPNPPRPMSPDELRRQLACPLCGRVLLTHPYLGPGNIVIDTCDACDIIWLEYGELERAVNAPGRDRGAALLKRQRDQALPGSDDDEEEEMGGRIDLFDVFSLLFS